MDDAPWPEGSFQEEFDLWQRDWFYITAPRGTTWVAPPAFRSGPPPRLASWVNEGLIWGPSKDVPLLQDRRPPRSSRHRRGSSRRWRGPPSPGLHHLVAANGSRGQGGSKAAVSTHPKYSQVLHQNYSNYASVSKKGVICGLTAAMRE